MDFMEDLLDVDGTNHRKHSMGHNGNYSGHGFCPRCSASLAQGAKYCQRCGASLAGMDGNNHSRRNSKRQKAATIVLIGFVVIIAILIVFIIFAAVYAAKNHTQILDGFSKVVQYVFGDSVENIFRNLVNQSIDNFFRNLLNGND